MSTNIASKNLYELLGNDHDLDPDREPEPPTQAIDKPVQRAGKRNAGAEGPPRDTPRPAGGGRGGSQQVMNRGDQAGSFNNRSEQRDDGLRQDRHPDRLRGPGEHRDIDGRGRGSRGGRGGRGGRGRGGEYRGTRTGRDDRHDRSGIAEHEKQAAHGWGETTGEGEWNDEKAGEAIAQAEVKEEPGFTPDTAGGDPAFTNGPDAPTTAEDAAPAEPEDNTKSYDQYLADLAEKRMALSGNTTDIRKPNEGSKQKFPEGTAFQRNPEEENFFSGSGGKARKQKETKEKERVELEGQYYAPVEQDGGRGRGGRGRGGGFRGDRGGERGGRGGDRGDRGDRGGERRGGRGRGDSRGGFRGDRGERSDRGPPRGGSRGGFNAQDQSAFPALGGN